MAVVHDMEYLTDVAHARLQVALGVARHRLCMDGSGAGFRQTLWRCVRLRMAAHMRAMVDMHL